MKKKITILISLLFSINFLFSQSFIDTVYSVKWGSGWQTIGRDSIYFPKNIFGPPCKNATKYIPASGPEDVVELGFGGEIIIGKKNAWIVNKEGPDFIIFENVFCYGNNKIFAEPGIVSVSKDSINWIEFPFSNETLKGLAGITWTNGNENCFDYTAIGGDAFDLEDIGIDSIKYIKIKDTAIIVSLLPIDHQYYVNNAILSGFDLDAVVILHYISSNSQSMLFQIYENDGNYYLYYNIDVSISIYDFLGIEIWNNSQLPAVNYNAIFSHKYSNGSYFIVARKEDLIEIKKVILIW